MQYLPRLAAGEAIVRLPLFEESAIGLAAALLDDDASARLERLTGVLTDDPSLTIWSALHPRRSRAAPLDVDELASWLSRNALAVLDWSSEPASPRSHDRPDSLDAWCRRAAAARALALAAAADAPTPQIASRVRLLAYLDDAVQWLLAGAAPRRLDSVEPLIPAWLRRLLIDLRSPAKHADPAIRAVADAKRRAGATADMPPVAIVPSEAPPGILLSALTGKLARLEQLEARFQDTLRDEKLSSLQKLAYGASHEINNPLANISARAQTLLTDEADPERRRALATINDQARRAFEMIANMMLFAKPPELNREEADLAAVAAEVIEELTPAADGQGTSLRCDAAGPVMLLADPVQLVILLRAMVRNALEAIECGGEVVISLRPGEEAVELSVRDTGPGLSEEARRHLFDPFYSSREAGRGLGFGLSWCWTIVRAHGGKIEFDSGPETGTTFVVTFPHP